jgi:glycosyltransferase involved in cell wall biosynthesis
VKVSFIIPAYNSAEFLHPAIESCLVQTHKDIEVIVVDDCSTDSTPDYVAWAKTQDWAGKVKFLRNETNLGRSAARNIGNKAATGEILAVLDADDINSPKRAELTVARFVAGAQFVHGAAHLMDAVGRDGGMVPTDVFNLDKAVESLSAGIVHSTVAYSKALAEKYPYLEGQPAKLGVDDFTVFMPMAFDGVKFDYIPAPLCAYRVNELGISAQRDNAEVVAFKKGFVESYRVTA